MGAIAMLALNAALSGKMLVERTDGNFFALVYEYKPGFGFVVSIENISLSLIV
jgi:hypothetical protein